MIERTKDYRIVNRIVPWKVIISQKFFYLLEKAGDSIIGLWTLEPHEDGLRVHADLGEKCRGKKAIESLKFAFDWVFRYTQFKKIYARIPVENKPAWRVASMAGMHHIKSDNNHRWYQLSKGW